MNRLSNKKKLAELKASLDILQEKYKDDKSEDLKWNNSRDVHIEHNFPNLKNLIADYLRRANSKKLSRKENI